MGLLMWFYYSLKYAPKYLNRAIQEKELQIDSKVQSTLSDSIGDQGFVDCEKFDKEIRHWICDNQYIIVPCSSY